MSAPSALAARLARGAAILSEPGPPPGRDGLPSASPGEERASRFAAIAAAIALGLVGLWEIAGPPLAGHYASSASVGIIAENMLRWRIAGPVWEYTSAAPAPDLYYCHHPWGIFWTTAAILAVMGRHDFVLRLAPVLLSAATPLLLYGLARSVWRPAAGAAAAIAFVVLPITLAFASFNALEVPVIAYGTLGLLGYVRFCQAYRARHLAACLGGFALALHADWPAFLLAGEVLAFGLARAFLLSPSVFGPIDARRYGRLWSLLAALCVATAALYVGLFVRSGKVDDLLSSCVTRSAGVDRPLAQVLEARRYWNELMFTPIAIGIGKVMAVVFALRWVALRREHEGVPLFVLGMATAQYVVFKQGADVHIFWPHYFAAYFALAIGGLVATIAPLLGPTRGAARALAIVAPPLLGVLRDGAPALRYARETGGRFNEKGSIIQSDGDRIAFLQWIEPTLPRDGIVDMHAGMATTWAQVWVLGGRVVSPNRGLPKGPASDGRGTYLADTRYLPLEAQQQLARSFRITAIGPLWKIDRNAPLAPLEGYSFAEDEPTLFRWLFVSATEPVRHVVPDPFVTWELRAHLGLEAPYPDRAPATLDQRRVAHNAAVDRGDLADAARLEGEVRAALRPIGARFDDGTEIMGAEDHAGAQRRLTLFVKARGPLGRGVELAVRSKVLAPPILSSTMADPVERDVGLPLAIPPERFRAGFLYADPVPIQKRPGAEVFRAFFATKGKPSAPRPVSGESPVVLELR
jgi:hypothetical protein